MVVNVIHILSIGIILCLITGCATTADTYPVVLEGMSRTNLRYWFGEPLRIEPVASGGEDWYYRFSSSESKPVAESGTKEEFGQQKIYASVGMKFTTRVEELPVRISADGFVVPPVPKGKIVKD